MSTLLLQKDTKLTQRANPKAEEVNTSKLQASHHLRLQHTLLTLLSLQRIHQPRYVQRILWKCNIWPPATFLSLRPAQPLRSHSPWHRRQKRPRTWHFRQLGREWGGIAGIKIEQIFIALPKHGQGGRQDEDGGIDYKKSSPWRTEGLPKEKKVSDHWLDLKMEEIVHDYRRWGRGRCIAK